MNIRQCRIGSKIRLNEHSQIKPRKEHDRGRIKNRIGSKHRIKRAWPNQILGENLMKRKQHRIGSKIGLKEYGRIKPS